jgi:hypothetical protein
VLVPVSTHGSANDRNCASASTMRLTMANKSKVLRASRSIRVTVTTSPGPALPSIQHPVLQLQGRQWVESSHSLMERPSAVAL